MGRDQTITPPTCAGLHVLDKSIDVCWGGYSQIRAEMLLYMSAYRHGGYGYYHLMSGQDLPLKPVDEINTFFEKNNGKEYIGFFKTRREDFADRVVYHYPLQDSHALTPAWRGRITAAFLRLQKGLHIRRNTHLGLKKGPNWCSLSSRAVELLVSKQRYIARHFGHGFCADEIYKQTIIWNSPLRDSIYDKTLSPEGNLYHIRWTEGSAHPHTFTQADEQELRQSTMLFARKFDDRYIFLL